MDKKTLILSLGRNNSLPVYAKSIYTQLPAPAYDVMVSKQSEVSYNGANKITVNTYTTGLQFIIRTIFYLPFLFISLIPKMYKSYKALYLPYMHFWDLPFIILFRLLGRKVVLTVHDGELHKGENGLLLRLQNYLEIKLATELIFLTDYVKTTVVKNFTINKPAFTIPHGLIGQEMPIPRNVSATGSNLVFIGRISPYKGVELLMDAVVGMEGIEKLIIAGKSIYKVNYLQHPKIEIRDNYQSDDDITMLLQWADILVLPYLEASQSGVIALGINATIPMVCTNVGGLSEQLSHDEAVFVNPDKISLQQGIYKLLEDRALYAKIVNNLALKKKSLSWPAIAAQIHRITG